MKPRAVFLSLYFLCRRSLISWPTLLAVGSFSVATFGASHSCFAQESEIETARRKFGQALELEVAEDWSGALKLYREVGLVKMTPQVRYHIATCEEQLGHLVAALGGYNLALRQSEGMHPDFIHEVEGSIEDLKARIPKLVIERGEGAEGAIISLDGVALGEAQIGSEIPVDPGPHQLQAEASGYQSFEETVVAREAESQRREVVLEVVVQTPVATQTDEGANAPEETEAGYGQLPYILGGSGLGVAVLGGVFLGVSQGKVSKINDTCNGETNCESAINGDPDLFDELNRLQKQANTFEALGWVGVTVGVGALAAGTVLYFIDPTRKEETATLQLKPYAPRSDVGFSLQAQF